MVPGLIIWTQMVEMPASSAEIVRLTGHYRECIGFAVGFGVVIQAVRGSIFQRKLIAGRYAREHQDVSARRNAAELVFATGVGGSRLRHYVIRITKYPVCARFDQHHRNVGHSRLCCALEAILIVVVPHEITDFNAIGSKANAHRSRGFAARSIR